VRNRYILILDILLIGLAAIGSFALRFDWSFFRTRADVWPFLVAALTVKPVVFLLFGMYLLRLPRLHERAPVLRACSWGVPCALAQGRRS
jgi:hypothetical protein